MYRKKELKGNTQRMFDHLRCIMVSVIVLNVVESGFESPSDLTKDLNIDICCFSAKHSTLRRMLA